MRPFLLLALLAAVVLDAGQASAQDGARETVILAVNDIYRLKGFEANREGGLPRLAGLRARLERDHPDLLLLHAGDILAPSLLGRRYKGRQMVDLMNWLDGRPEADDPRLFVTFGNHEFDDSRCGRDSSPLPARLDESGFTWLVANLDFSDCAGLAGVPGHARVEEAVVVESGGIRIGLFGLGRVPDDGNRKKYPAVRDTLETATRMIRDLKAGGAEFIVALTHLPAEADEALLAAAAPLGLDLIVGGHDHSHMALPAGAPRIFKADSDARSAWRLALRIGADGARSVEGELIVLDAAAPPDPAVEARADHWLERHDVEFCTGLKPPLPHGCLAQVYSRTRTLLEAEELANRGGETGFGDWLADRVRRATGAEVALLNAGGLRLNVNLAPGSAITRRQVEELIQYDDVLATVEIDAGTLRAALDHGLRRQGSGGWPHVSGIAVRRGADGGLAALSLPAGGGEPAPERRLSFASIPYLLCGGDDYDFGQKRDGESFDGCIARLRAAHARPLNAEEGSDPACLHTAGNTVAGFPAGTLTLKSLFVAALCAAGEAGIAPEKDGRIGS